MKSPLRRLRRSGRSGKVHKGKNKGGKCDVQVASLGVGSFPCDGEITFTPAVKLRDPPSEVSTDTTRSTNSNSNSASLYNPRSSTFMRIADLQLLANLDTPGRKTQDDELPVHEHYHQLSAAPPAPGIDHDPKERWVALDNGTGGSDHAPLAPYAVDALVKGSISAAIDKQMWKASKPTEKILSACEEWASAAWDWASTGPIQPPSEGSGYEKSVLIWAGQFSHGLYGGDLPTIRAMGLVNMPPRALVDLLVDSRRVNEYNKMSLGRTDVLVLHDSFLDHGPFGRSVTKVVQSETQPPLVRKRLQFVTLMHAEELEDKSGFIIVSRAVTRGEEPMDVSDGILRSEILMGVNIIKNVKGDKNRAMMLNINHIRSPMVPLFIAKKIGLSAAEGFFDDIRALC